MITDLENDVQVNKWEFVVDVQGNALQAYFLGWTAMRYHQDPVDLPLWVRDFVVLE